MNDLVSDMLLRVNNGLSRKKENVDLVYSKLVTEIARILVEEGFILYQQILTRGKKKILRVGLKYVLDKFGKPQRGVISGLKVASRPGRRMYVSFRKIPKVRCGLGSVVLTTPKGVMADNKARKEKVGGEVLCFVW
ncbi:MAG: rpsH [Candidatus Saganbacteria bacterium]|uniref:Small ribosomal subunit protein uS8 n=1 Tax=Candidatus Saganbacteria bacterium TaxID=2575572 RepID=A0A833L158_UNCSA|nr:MAG: rpsH [Candidatus Saganbacteria bacterium]